MKKQKILKVIFISFIMICLSLISCSPEENAPPDPEGTVTVNLSGYSALLLCQGAFGDLKLGMNPAGVYVVIYILNSDGSPQGEIADIGNVNGLGDVINKPTAGYTYECALTKGHGYVLRYRQGVFSNTALPLFYGRFYVVDFLTDYLGGIQGATIKYQGPF